MLGFLATVVSILWFDLVVHDIKEDNFGIRASSLVLGLVMVHYQYSIMRICLREENFLIVGSMGSCVHLLCISIQSILDSVVIRLV